jgi:hypothetical protein
MEKQGARENPVRRSGYALQGGAGPQVERFQLASERAGEVQANRTNPRRKGATPTMGVSEVRGGYTGQKALEKALAQAKAKGGRAVPSSGLSQFRGGGGIVGGGKACSDMEGGARAPEILARESAKRPVIRAGLSDQHSVEAKEMGRHLGKHLKTVRGGGFYELFTKGIVEAGREGDAMRKEEGMPPTQVAPPPSSAPPDMPPPVVEDQPKGGALFYRKGDMSKEKEQHHEEHTARRFGMVRKGGYLSGPYEGMGMSGGAESDSDEGYASPSDRRKAISHNANPRQGARERSRSRSRERKSRETPDERRRRERAEREAREQDELEKRMREASLKDEEEKKKKEDEEKKGKGRKKRRAPAGASDGRRARAEIVKRVMKEQGFKSMIEASKYVKAHNLY